MPESVEALINCSMTGTDGHRLVLQKRDRHLLDELAMLRVIDREQAKIVAGFGSTPRANARLLALTRAGFLRRFFLGTAAGGRKALYCLSAKATKLIGKPDRGPRRRMDETLESDYFVPHQLLINKVYCALRYPPGPIPVPLGRWVGICEPLGDDQRFIPDAYFELGTGTLPTACFLELDRGHEGLTFWKRKVQAYLQFATSGEFERRFGQARFRLLIITTSEHRLRSIARVVGAVTDKIFWLTTIESIDRAGLFAPVWLRPRGTERQALL